MKDTIQFSKEDKGGHAFAIVGYNEVGFWVQNSWGKEWGNDGLAIWTYEDWQQNIQDAWVLRLALSTPQIWHESNDVNANNTKATASKGPERGKIAGHFVHLDDGDFKQTGKYWSTLNDVKITTENLEKSDKYDHLLIYFHGGLNNPAASAKRISAMKDVFKANRIYPYHFMYDTGLMEELKDVIFRKKKDVSDRAEGITSATDWIIEKLSHIPGRALWREMKRGAKSPFNQSGAGTKVIELFANAIINNNKIRHQQGKTPFKIHIVGHSTGAIMAGWMLNRMNQMLAKKVVRIASTSLLAPAASLNNFTRNYMPVLTSSSSKFGIDKLYIYCLDKYLEKKDTVGPYRKSLLYLVSRAFEEKKKMPILGMQKHHDQLPKMKNMQLIYSQGENGSEIKSFSETHGGFDNDIKTMNDILLTVLNEIPRRAFTVSDLKY